MLDDAVLDDAVLDDAVLDDAVLDDAFLAAWCARHLGARPTRLLFRSGHLSEVVGVELDDGRRVVIKSRPAEPRIAGCTAVQGRLARSGFPCPMPLTAPVQAGGLTVTAETFLPGGRQRPADGGAAPFAALLARLISSAPSPADVPGAGAFATVDRMGPSGRATVAGPR